MKHRINIFAFSVIEVILASALFVVLATGSITVILQGLDSNRLGEEQTVANHYAAEGIEAIRSIKNQNFTNLINTAGTGVSRVGNVWTFAGSNNVFDTKYTRVLSVSDVQRDVNGNIVTSGGTLDSMTKKITSTVSWNMSAGRSNAITLTSYVTDFRKAFLTTGGILVYGDGASTPKYRMYDGSADTFGSELAGATAASGQTFTVRTSPTKTEAIAGFVTSAGELYIQCFDGSTWTQDWNLSVGGNSNTRRFDIAYENTSGDVMILYSRDVGTTNELGYRVKSGNTGCGSANWSVASNLDPVRTSGVVHWVKMAWDRRTGSDLITAIWADVNRDLSAQVWNGSAWGNEPSNTTETSLEIVSTAQDIEDFDVEYESLSGDALVVWANSAGSNGTNGVRYRTCTGGGANCTWNAVTTPPGLSDDATNLDIAANPSSDEIIFASIGDAGNDLQLGHWSGSTWTSNATAVNADTSCNPPVAGTRNVSTGWLVSGATTRSVVVYADQGSNNIDWYIGNGASFTKQTDFAVSPAPTNPNRYYDLQMNPLSKDQLLFTISDNNSDLFSKRLFMTAAPAFTWTNSDASVLETSLPQSINSPFSFAFWRNP